MGIGLGVIVVKVICIIDVMLIVLSEILVEFLFCVNIGKGSLLLVLIEI